MNKSQSGDIIPRERVLTALRHEQPDRLPVDFLATPEIWRSLGEHIRPDVSKVKNSECYDPAWEAIMRHFEVDCRVLSYDQFLIRQIYPRMVQIGVRGASNRKDLRKEDCCL